MGAPLNPTQEDRAGYTMYAGYNSQVCEYWKQRIGKEESCVMGMLEQSRTTPRNPIVASRSKSKATTRQSRPNTAKSAYSESEYSYRSSRPSTAQSNRTSSTMRTEEEALLRSTLSRLDQLESKLDQERNARKQAEADLRELKGMVSESGSVRSVRSRRSAR